MSIECGDCERDLRGGHAPDCKRLKQRRPFSTSFDLLGKKKKRAGKVSRGLACIVCDRPIVTMKNTMCQNCDEAYYRFNRRDNTNLGLIRWAVMRSRKFAGKRLVEVEAGRDRWKRHYQEAKAALRDIEADLQAQLATALRKAAK